MRWWAPSHGSLYVAFRYVGARMPDGLASSKKGQRSPGPLRTALSGWFVSRSRTKKNRWAVSSPRARPKEPGKPKQRIAISSPADSAPRFRDTSSPSMGKKKGLRFAEPRQISEDDGADLSLLAVINNINAVAQPVEAPDVDAQELSREPGHCEALASALRALLVCLPPEPGEGAQVVGDGASAGPAGSPRGRSGSRDGDWLTEELKTVFKLAAPPATALNPGEPLISQGDQSNGAMYLLLGGELQMTRERNGTSVDVLKLEAGALIGEIPFLLGVEPLFSVAAPRRRARRSSFNRGSKVRLSSTDGESFDGNGSGVAPRLVRDLSRASFSKDEGSTKASSSFGRMSFSRQSNNTFDPESFTNAAAERRDSSMSLSGSPELARIEYQDTLVARLDFEHLTALFASRPEDARRLFRAVALVLTKRVIDVPTSPLERTILCTALLPPPSLA